MRRERVFFSSVEVLVFLIFFFLVSIKKFISRQACHVYVCIQRMHTYYHRRRVSDVPNVIFYRLFDRIPIGIVYYYNNMRLPPPC